MGTFFVLSRSAEISTLTGAIEPPCRELFFQAEETGDVAFVKNMAEKEFISEQTAMVWIKQYVDSLKEKLDAGQKCKVGQLGEFTKNAAGHYAFSAEKINLLDDSFAFTTLKGVKTFDVEQTITPIQTKQTPLEEEPEPIVEEPTPAYSVSEPETIEPTPEPELPKETVSHTEAVVAAELEQMTNESEQTEELVVESAPIEEAELKPIEKEVEIEDIKPQSEELRAQAQAIIEENRRQKEEEKEAEKAEKEEKKRKKKAKKRRKRVLVVVLCVLLFLLLCCGGFVAAFYFNVLPDKPFLKPITERLSYYIKPKAQPVKLAAPTIETPIELIEETFTEEIAETETLEAEAIVVETEKPQIQTPKPVAKKTQTKKEEKKAEEPKPAPAPAVDNTSPVVVQNYSRLGFDVVGASTDNRANAERLARKAKSLGYDSYVLKKVKSGSDIYYVSYGSRRSLEEANNLMAKMIEKLGGDYYVISR